MTRYVRPQFPAVPRVQARKIREILIRFDYFGQRFDLVSSNDARASTKAFHTDHTLNEVNLDPMLLLMGTLAALTFENADYGSHA